MFQRQNMTNLTAVSVFIPQGFSADPELQLLSVAAFLLIYLAAVLGNIFIVAAVTLDTCLHTPMYFFLKHLSLVDICSISTTLPRALVATMVGSGEISLPACASQLFAFVCLGSTECFLITSMAYDRCLAIYRPLGYGTVMNRQTCVSLVMVSWGSGLLFSTFHPANTFSLPFCGPNVIDQFFCDISPLMRLACANVDAHEVAGFAASGCVIISCFVITVLSYICIFTTVVQIRSDPFSCRPLEGLLHMFFPPGHSAPVLWHRQLCLHAAHHLLLPSGRALGFSVFSAVLIPTLNPLIYSLRNKDMQRALRKLYL